LPQEPGYGSRIPSTMWTWNPHQSSMSMEFREMVETYERWPYMAMRSGYVGSLITNLNLPL
jgi:hypothetical protein